ncbi:hypothetical protein ANSO36C_34070 [Nostoc cf. commune SO-36]|uniref:Uncharacterized protein n=1 Tax=Nostoc cf. commune SO-36 TaxID=449208 RepID=A0ABN6Q5Q2_NOSCO|nr:hypothetical protein ANSO36C_34070 [Nostoc cf. commune SO-36]
MASLIFGETKTATPITAPIVAINIGVIALIISGVRDFIKVSYKIGSVHEVNTQRQILIPEL